MPAAVQLLPLLKDKALEACIVLAARLTFIPGAAFVQQFVTSGGLNKACIASILGPLSSGAAPQPGAAPLPLPADAVIVEALHLLSNVARASAAHYAALQVVVVVVVVMMMMMTLSFRNATCYPGCVGSCSTRVVTCVRVCARWWAICSGS